MGKRRSKTWLIRVGLGLLVASFSQPAGSAPLDLQESTPRWIEVQFEVSPDHAPGQLNSTWSVPRAAYLEPDVDPSLLRIRIPKGEIEAHLRTTGTEPVPGSFSEFVWTLDARTGHVLAADLTGRVRQHLSFGLIQTSAAVDIRVQMSTQRPAGFRPSRGLFGVRTHSFCAPAARRSRCVEVAPRSFDPLSGYVNAVGSVVASAKIAEIRAFSPLGEVRFSEQTLDGPQKADSGTSESNAVCSGEFDGSCWADLGGDL